MAYSGIQRLNIFYFLLFIGTLAGLTYTMEISEHYLWNDPILRIDYRKPLTCDDTVLQKICYKSCGKYYKCEDNTCKCLVLDTNQNKSPTASIENFQDILRADSTITAIDNLKEYQIPLTCDGIVLHKICFKKCGKYYTCEGNTCKCSEIEKNVNEGLANAVEKFQNVLNDDSIVTAIDSLKEYHIPLTCDEMVCFKRCGQHYTCENNICKCTEPEQQNSGNKNIMVNILRDIEELLKLYDNSVYTDFTQATDSYPSPSKETEELRNLEVEQVPQKYLRHHIAHFCENLGEARKCIKKCSKVGKPAFCGKDHVCYCGHRYTSHDENKPINIDDTYAEFRDLYEKYFGPQSNEQESGKQVSIVSTNTSGS